MLVVSARSAKSRTGSGKIPSGQDKEEADRFEMSKENFGHCSPHSLFETHSGRASTEDVRGKCGGERKPIRSAVHPRKRALSDSRLSAPPSTTHGRELTPPELTTSDNFKPAKRVLGPKPALAERKKLTLVKAGVPPSPAAPSSAKLVPRMSIPVDNSTSESNSPRLGTSASRNSLTARKSSLTGRRLSVIRLSVSKEKGASVNPREKECLRKVMAFSAKSAGQQTTPRVQQKDVENGRSKVTEKKVASAKYPVPSGNPSNTVKPVTVAKDESAAKTRLVARYSGSTKAVAENTRTRKLSMVLQSEQRLQEQNQTLELQLRQLQEKLILKDNEIERLRSAGLILNNLAKNQSDEVRDLKFRLKETFNENAEVRDICEKLVKERQELAARRKEKEEELDGRNVGMRLDSLTVKLQIMGVDPLPSGKDLPCSESSGSTNEDERHEKGVDDEVDEATFEVHSEVQEDFGSKADAGELESETPIGAGTVHKWNEVADEVTEDVPVRRHPEAPLTQEISAVGYHEELLAAVRAVQDAEDSGLSDSMRNELEVIGDLQSALKVISDLHPAAGPLLIP